MAFTLFRDDGNNLITVTYQKETTYQDRVDLLNQLIEILKTDPKINLLINTSDAETRMSDEQQLEYGKLLASNAHYFQFNRTAVVNKNANPHPFILVGAYAEGFSNVAEFDKIGEALAWINGELR